jgi:hypothetical protein
MDFTLSFLTIVLLNHKEGSTAVGQMVANILAKNLT